MVRNQIIVALDGISKKNALSIARKLKKTVWGFKINDLLFEDPKIVKELKRYGKVFADAKLYDIPNTVKNSVQRLSKLGADIITVHASGGVAMMRVAKEAAGKSKIVGVTVLTSQPGNQKKSVLKLAKEAQSAGLDGVVCSAQELPYLSRIKLLKIVPGIRPVWYKTGDDQRRTATPKEAIKAGADLIIIGRPITESKDLKEAINDL
ncbi:MAG: orotidine 5'-phosphate decarboxylase [Candidatus Yanofskybacteria bacterium RIFCSPHIGHO2_02_FULL_50_12]|uniref:Orotidine 5'-phosphate decarboxylase n=1 Tax=Candidatus Yanofskybacteria bacterium RIFCSPHIGHO2_02_FULL_50_12 TaxID=1802685 RepID=A0A1F8FYB5_9BACT|nr:MAG: orotidine 5'-phosphate decarboxylase [Candidatus Yanofskybacteria bacterium RIFCSPHIGHO2_02_FULL_50_12]